MTPEKRRAPPVWDGATSGDDVEFAGYDTFRVTHSASDNQASLQRRDRFARGMVFEEFRYKYARALNYGGFVDRQPDQVPRYWRST